MKYGFFFNNYVYSIAESEEEKNFLLPYLKDAILKELTDSQFENAKNYKCRLAIQDNAVIEETLVLHDPLNSSTADFDHARSVLANEVHHNWVAKIDGWLKNNLESEHHSYWTNYRNKLTEVDFDSLSFPLEYESFMEWFNNQTDNPTKSPLQLP